MDIFNVNTDRERLLTKIDTVNNLIKGKRNVLYIDDEQQALTSFRANFRREANVFTANNYPDALRILKENQIEAVISDFLMPDIKGDEIINMLKNRFPDITYCILTGYMGKPSNGVEVFYKPMTPKVKNSLIEFVYA